MALTDSAQLNIKNQNSKSTKIPKDSARILHNPTRIIAPLTCQRSSTNQNTVQALRLRGILVAIPNTQGVPKPLCWNKAL